MTAVDLLIKHGCIIDGTGNPRYRGDVAIKDGVIVEMGELSDEIAKRVIDAEDLVVCPGFIDVHTHSDLVLLADPINEAKLRQGVTTEILGQDGLSYAPLSASSLKFMRHYLSGLNGNPKIEIRGVSVKQFLRQFRASVNVAYLVPHGALRLEAMGMDDRPPTKRELAFMQQACAKALSDGAVGLSTALAYAPCTYASTEELISLNEVVAQYNGCFVVHLRNIGDNCLDPIREIIEIGRESGVACHISHLKPRKGHFGRAEAMVQLIHDANEAGLDLTFDAYPYGQSGGFLLSLLPAWVFSMGFPNLIQFLSLKTTRDRIQQEFLKKDPAWQQTIIAGVGNASHSAVGSSIAEYAASLGLHPVDAVCNLLVEHGLAVATRGNDGPPEADLETIMKSPVGMISSDGLMVGSSPHPRGFGTYGRILGRYVREREFMSLEEAIHKMTALPAKRFALTDRGQLRVGMAADIAIFDPESIIDRATIDDGRRYTTGVHYVIVNGQVVLDKQGPTGSLPGSRLKAGVAAFK